MKRMRTRAATKKRRASLPLERRVSILEGYCDGLIRQSLLALDTRLKAVEKR